MFVGGIGDGIAAIFFLAALGVVFVCGAVIALFLKIIGMGSGRAVLWGFGVPLAGFAAMGVIAFATARETAEREDSIGLPAAPGSVEAEGR